MAAIQMDDDVRWGPIYTRPTCLVGISSC